VSLVFLLIRFQIDSLSFGVEIPLSGLGPFIIVSPTRF